MCPLILILRHQPPQPHLLHFHQIEDSEFHPGLEEQGGGHFSPIAAYDVASDRFLILDVARYKYPPIWVKAADLWNAINTKDKDSQKNHGILIVRSVGDHER